ncbi:peptide chain release factor N(5)-glutamine methyltransferase [bacterium]|nr:peptide chain release factor N(5)-glutamine methyltransferase [bacterium]
MTIKEILIEAQEKLSKKNINSARLDAEVLLMYMLKKSKEWLYVNNDSELSTPQLKKYRKIIAERLKRKPVSYLINNKEFYGLDFYVNKDVLTPRPETEKLIELALTEILKTKGKLEIAEVGIGSGCISAVLAIELLKNKKNFYIYATDISQKAIKVANINLKKHKIKKYVKVKKEDILNTNSQFDFIISNPPYVPKRSKLEKELSFEPKQALFPNKGFIKKFLKSTLSHTKNGGYIFLEIDPSWKEEIVKLKKDDQIDKILFEKDLKNLTRYTIIKKKLR